MSLYHQLWAAPLALEELQKEHEAIQQAQRLTVKTKRERAYLEAVESLYQSDKIPYYSATKLAYQQAIELILLQNPDDREAIIFYALSLISTASPEDKTYANQKKALDLLQNVLEHEPDHPGVAHYIIHSNDYLELAKLRLNAAHAYTRIALAVPHALHIPLQELQTIKKAQPENTTSAYAYAEIRAHYAIKRGEWRGSF